MNCQKSGLDTVGSSISIVDLLRNDDASIDDWSSILRSSIYRVFIHDGILSPALMVVGCSGVHCAVLVCTGLYWAVLGCSGM